MLRYLTVFIDFSIRAAFAIAVVVCCIPSAIAVETTLQGWGNYRFGMTPDQVRAIPGLSWLPLETRKLFPGKTYEMTERSMKSLVSSRVEGHDFQVRTAYNKNMELYNIGFSGAERTMDSSTCEQVFQEFLRRFEVRYGSFSPTGAPGKTELGNLIIAKEWRSLPGGTSKYLSKMSNEIINTEAERKFGQASVHVNMEADNSKRSCSINFVLDSGKGDLL